MRIETNQRLIDRNKKWAGRMFFITFGVIIGSFLLLNSPFLIQDIAEGPGLLISLIAPALLLPLAFLSTIFSVRMTNQWVRQPRPERALPDNLKGLGKSAVLYNYFHFPARHVLITQAGVIAAATRWQDGSFQVTGDKWSTRKNPISRVLSLMRMDGIGNPSLDAQIAAQHVDGLLRDINPDVPVYGVVLFVDPKAEVEVVDSAIPILYIDTKRRPNLKDWVKSLPKADHQLSPEQIAQFEQKTVPVGAREI
jgi:hypothetical protein